jgi:hypothetical protein
LLGICNNHISSTNRQNSTSFSNRSISPANPNNYSDTTSNSSSKSNVSRLPNFAPSSSPLASNSTGSMSNSTSSSSKENAKRRIGFPSMTKKPDSPTNSQHQPPQTQKPVTLQQNIQPVNQTTTKVQVASVSKPPPPPQTASSQPSTNLNSQK